MLFEILKNSLRAVVETHGVDSDDYPPIKVIVAEGQDDITIKISDEGGGIARRDVPLVVSARECSCLYEAELPSSGTMPSRPRKRKKLGINSADLTSRRLLLVSAMGCPFVACTVSILEATSS